MIHQPRILVIYKRSTLERYKGIYDRRIASLLRAKDESVAQLIEAHEAHRDTMKRTRFALKKIDANARFAHAQVPSADEKWDLVITLGGDGTLLWASHLVDATTPMLAINSSPETSVGYFCASDGKDIDKMIDRALSGQLKKSILTRMKVDIDEKTISHRVLNDILFCHSCPAAASRYILRYKNHAEEQLSSGLWVGPAAGSTAAQRSAGGRILPPQSKKIQFIVREPYQGDDHCPRFKQGLVAYQEKLAIKSMIREGMLYIDGHSKTCRVDIGSEIYLSASEEPLTLLGLKRT